ncbi:MAG: bacterial transcriptional activator domain-containing protein [Candidatus Eremiobacteraeota bacterium]|nr:bacterial transcriptional activator domain-containing protein [Candidatus Eremiobacteraeota bacterium]
MLAAPPGYGKKSFACSAATEYSHSLTLQCAPGERVGDLLARLRNAIAELPPIGTWLAVLEDAESLAEGDLASLVRDMLPDLEVGALTILSSRAPSAKFDASFPPNEVHVIRRSQMALNIRDLGNFQEFSKLDRSTQFRIAVLAHGWIQPMLILAENITFGASPWDLNDSESELWGGVFDWIEAKVIGPLPEDLRLALVAATTFRDLAERDFGDFDGKMSNIATQLCEEYQIAERINEVICVLPIIRWCIHKRFQSDMRDAAASIVGTLTSSQSELRAIRGFVAIGELGEAAKIASQRHLFDLSNYAYPGLILEYLQGTTPNYASYPWLWLALLPARRPFCKPEQLSAEGLAAMEYVAGDDTLYTYLRVATATLLAQMGNPERARELLGGIGGDRWSDRLLNYADIFIAAGESRFDDALACYQKYRVGIGTSISWFAYVRRIMFRAQIERSLASGERLQFEDVLTSMHLRKLPFADGTTVAFAYYLLWLQGECPDATGSRFALMRHLYRSGSHMLWRSAAAIYGIELNGPVDCEPFDYVFSLLFLAECAEERDERRIFIERAIEFANRNGIVGIRIASYLALAVCDPDRSADALANAIRLAEHEGRPELSEGIKTFGRGEYVSNPRYMDVFAKRFAIFAPEERGDEGTFSIDIVRGSVGSRDGSRLHAAEGTLALLALLVTEGGTIQRERALDVLWPNLDPFAASNALKACLHRARRQLGDSGAIELRDGELRLGGMFRSNLPDILSLAESGDPSRDAEHMMAVLHSIAGESWSWAPWEWFEKHVRRMREAARSIGASLLTAEMEANEFSAAMATARAMVDLEPFDELPRSAIVRAHLAMGNRPLAIDELRRYEELLKDELGVELPSELTALLKLTG